MGGIAPGRLYLIFTHVLLWWWAQPDHLSSRALGLLNDPHNSVVFSAASAGEIATKYRIGKMPSGGRIITQWEERIGTDGFMELTISPGHYLRAGTLPRHPPGPLRPYACSPKYSGGDPDHQSRRSLKRPRGRPDLGVVSRLPDFTIRALGSTRQYRGTLGTWPLPFPNIFDRKLSIHNFTHSAVNLVFELTTG